ncbi:MAG TPA: Inorganic pyrophosphatase [Erysipelothrix sp.]|nr:Inorganic pyrophosphatase [Erysipelothrix sp.]
MEQLLNNAFFWQKLDTLLFTLDYNKVRGEGDEHPKYPNLVYPVEYGYLVDPDKDGVVVAKAFRGSASNRRSDQIILCVDILQKDMDVKILMGCTEEEQMKVLEFLNQTAFQKTVLIRRGDETPQWAMDD